MIDKQRKEVTGQGDCVASGWWSEHQSTHVNVTFFFPTVCQQMTKCVGV